MTRVLLDAVVDASAIPVPLLLLLVWYELRGLRSAVEVQSARLYELRRTVDHWTALNPLDTGSAIP